MCTCNHGTMRHLPVYQTLAIGITISVLALCYDYWATRVKPYCEKTRVTPFFTTSIESDGSLRIAKVRDPQVVHLPLAPLILYAEIVRESIFRLLGRDADGPLAGKEDEIIAALHAERFDPERAYVITGGHFPDLYVRNLGIFYSSLLDARIPASEEDWLNRQRLTLQTLATHLELLRMAGKVYTTFAPVGPRAFAAINWNDEPSDSLFAITYTPRAATDDSFISRRLPAPEAGGSALAHRLTIQYVADGLLGVYRPVIEKELARYLKLVMDPATGLVKKEVALSGARDNVRPESGFYDNIIAYATAKDAAALGLSFPCPERYSSFSACDFAQWKKRIVLTFWREKNNGSGFFLDDPSAQIH